MFVAARCCDGSFHMGDAGLTYLFAGDINMARNFIARGLVSAVAVLLSSVAFAQTAPQQPAPAATAQQPAAAEPGGSQIEEVVVTATRRSELLSKVPQSISAFTTEKMDQLNVKIHRRSRRLHARRDASTKQPRTSRSAASIPTRATPPPASISTTRRSSCARWASAPTTRCRPCSIWSASKSCADRRARCSARVRKAARCATSPRSRASPITASMRKSELSDTEDGAPSYEGGAAVGGPIVDDKLGFRISALGTARRRLDRQGRLPDDPDHVLQSDTNSVDTYVVRGALAWQPIAGTHDHAERLLSEPRSEQYRRLLGRHLRSRRWRLQDRHAREHGRQGPLHAVRAEGRLRSRRHGADFQHLVSSIATSSCRTTAARSTISPTSSSGIDSRRRRNPDYDARLHRAGSAAPTG